MQLTTDQISLLQTQWVLSDIQFIRRVANFVYSAKLNGRQVVLRLSEKSHRQPEEIAAELHWMDYLAQNQVKLAKPIRGNNQSFIFELSTYIVSVFEWAPGKALRELGTYSDEHLFLWGKYLGKMHRLTKDYQCPESIITPRISWDKEDNFVTAKRSVTLQNKEAFDKFDERVAWIKTLPKHRDNFGLIHSDLHNGNFFIENNVITAFDFDDCCYHWFYYDFASALMWPVIDGDENTLRHLSSKMIKGYETENQFDYSESELKQWMKYRAIISYHWLQTSINEGVFQYNPKVLEQCERWLPLLLKI